MRGVDDGGFPGAVAVVVAGGRRPGAAARDVRGRTGPDRIGLAEDPPRAGVVDQDTVGAAGAVEVVGDLARGEQQGRGDDGGEAAGGHGQLAGGEEGVTQAAT